MEWFLYILGGISSLITIILAIKKIKWIQSRIKRRQVIKKLRKIFTSGTIYVFTIKALRNKSGTVRRREWFDSMNKEVNNIFRENAHCFSKKESVAVKKILVRYTERDIIYLYDYYDMFHRLNEDIKWLKIPPLSYWDIQLCLRVNTDCERERYECRDL